jgi:ribonuclease HI
VKTLKLDHALAQQVLKGKKMSTWRINDDKDLHVNDAVSLIDKVVPTDPASWQVIGVATITSILEKQLGQVNQSDMEQHEKFSSIEEVIKTFRGYYGPQVGAETPVKIIRFTFAPAAEGQLPFDVRPPAIATHAKLYADGGSRGNPGPSASGYVLFDEHDKIIIENGLFLGVTTNNQAEYQALKIGLEEALKRGITHVDVFMDSMLVVNQMKGTFKVKNRDLVAIHQSVQQLVRQFMKVTFTHVPRELNKLADAMVNEVLDAEAARQ